jgi:hypothetical protein
MFTKYIYSYRIAASIIEDMFFNPLNAELNPIYHLLILLGDLTFMSTCILSIFQYRGRDGTGFSVLWVAYATHSTLQPVLIMGGVSTRNM